MSKMACMFLSGHGEALITGNKRGEIWVWGWNSEFGFEYVSNNDC